MYKAVHIMEINLGRLRKLRIIKDGKMRGW